MSKPNFRAPKYRLHKASGQAIVTIDGRDFYLGPYRSAASKRKYDRLIGEWLAAGRCLPPKMSGSNDLTIVELCAAYLRFAKSYYGDATSSLDRVRVALRLLRKPYGELRANEFGPLSLQAIMQGLAESGKSRRYVNHLTGAIKRVFRWGASQELLPVSVFQALATVGGLKLGRTVARESEPIQPVSDAVIQRTLPHLPKPVRAMVELQRLTGCRAGEIAIMRPHDIARLQKVWAYRPESHKTTHLGRQRVVFIGPRAQAILAPWLLRDAMAYCFSPRESEDAHNAERREARKSPLTPSQSRRRRKSKPARAPGDRYLVPSYGQAIRRACEEIDRLDHEANPDAPTDEVLFPAWTPLQLRHTAATEIRSKYDLEGAQAVLGHAHARITEVYANRDLAKAAQIMGEVG